MIINVFINKNKILYFIDFVFSLKLILFLFCGLRLLSLCSHSNRQRDNDNDENWNKEIFYSRKLKFKLTKKFKKKLLFLGHLKLRIREYTEVYRIAY